MKNKIRELGELGFVSDVVFEGKGQTQPKPAKDIYIDYFFLTQFSFRADLGRDKYYIKNFEELGGAEKEISYKEMIEAHKFIKKNENIAEKAIEENDKYLEKLWQS